MDSAKKVAINTVFLYGKMLITISISLFSTRLILGALGVEDFGVFNIVAGVVGMLSFLNGAMAVSTQRYLSFYLGANEVEKQKDIFNASVLLHLIIGVIIAIALEIAGIFLFDGALNIPADRVEVAKKVYHFVVVSTFFTINAVPYDASINAHENMLLDSVVGVIEALMKLGIAIWLVHTDIDKLILYGLLFASMTIIIRLIKSVYCSKNYDECTVEIKRLYKPGIFKEMFSFASWNLFGAFCNVIRSQGLAVVLNIFVGVIANAAYGIANQINGLLSTFSINMMRSINPQIVKSEGSGDRERMLKLATLACKFSFFLLSVFAIPLIIEMDFMLNLWLKDVPEYAVIFCQLALVVSLLKQITGGLMVAVQSVGDIKVYQSVVSTLLILNLPVAILLLKLKFPPHSVFIGSIFLEIVAGLSRVFFAKKLTGLNANHFIVKIIIFSFFSIGMAYLAGSIPRLYLEDGLIRLMLTFVMSFTTIVLSGIFIAFTKEENMRIKGLVSSFIGDAKSKLDNLALRRFNSDYND